MGIKWGSLGEVFLVGLGVTVVVVTLFSLGAAAWAARSASTDSTGGGGPTFGGPGSAAAVAVTCFVVCALVALYGIYLILPDWIRAGVGL